MIKLQNQQQVAVDLNAFAKKLGIARKTVYRRTTMELWNEITKRTPVDTGRARSSWNLSIGRPNTAVPPEGPPGQGKHKDKPSPPVEPVNPVPPLEKVDGEEIIYITSSLPYIERLENGHSKQAPVGMVMVSAKTVVARIELILEGMQ